MIFLAKLGFTAYQVREMNHLEVSAWVESVSRSQGINTPTTKGDTVHYHLVRRAKNKGA